MKQIKYENDDHLDAIKRRALIMKPNLPNVVATDMGWCQPRPFGGMELLVSFANLDEILGMETVSDYIDSAEPLIVKLDKVVEEEIDDDSDLPPPNDLASLIMTKPPVEVQDAVLEKPELKDFLEQIKNDVEEEKTEEVTTAPKKKAGGRPKKATQ